MAGYVTLDASLLDTDAAYSLLIGCVVPRPIAWITTVDAAGKVNAAPFSSFNYVAHSPPMLAVNIGSRVGEPKDTARNIADSREFVVNVATEATLEVMHKSSAEYPPEVSEAEALGIRLEPSRFVKPPRIAASPIQMECRLERSITLGRGINTLYIGEIIAFHLSTEIFDGRRVDSAKMRPVARLGGPYYAALGEIFNRPRLHQPPGGTAGLENG
jgi:flavin reductase (DIM6/NTAB) family NADH-FMN oxidoreductase RutF